MKSTTITTTTATTPAATAIPTIIPVEKLSSGEEELVGEGDIVDDGTVVGGGVVNNLVGVVMTCTTNKMALKVSSYYHINIYSHNLIHS